MVKKSIVSLLVFLIFSSTSFAFFGKKDKETTLRVGVTPVPQGEILRFVKETFENESFTLDIVEYHDYNQPNFDLEDGKIDVNYFQHKDFLDVFNIEKRTQLVAVGKIHFERMGIYSNKVKSIKAIDGRIAIPNDESNKIRALKLLEKSGLITLDENNIILENPKNIEVTEISSNYLYKIIDEVDAIVVNANYMLENGYIPSKDSLYLEEYKEEYANLLVCRARSKKLKEIEKLKELLSSPEVKRFVRTHYKESVVLVD